MHEKLRQLYHCCEEDFSYVFLKRHAAIVNSSEQELLRITNQLNIILVLAVVKLSDFLSSRQIRFESKKLFAARLKGKARTPVLSQNMVSYTDITVKDVLLTGLADDEIRKEIVEWGSLDE